MFHQLLFNFSIKLFLTISYLSVDLIEPKCSIKEDSFKEKRRVSAILEEMPSDIGEEGFVISRYISSFQPIYHFSNWVQPGTTTKRLTVAILLPSGISAGHFLFVCQKMVLHSCLP